MDIGGLHANETGLPGRKAKADDGQKYKGDPANLRRNAREVCHQQNDACHGQAQYRADLTGVDDIGLHKTGHAIDVVVVETNVVITEQIDLGTGYAANFEVVLNMN